MDLIMKMDGTGMKGAQALSLISFLLSCQLGSSCLDAGLPLAGTLVSIKSIT